MKTILFHPSERIQSGMFGSKDGVSKKDEEFAPWCFLRARLEERGYKVMTTYDADFNVQSAHRIVFMNVPDELRSVRYRVKFLLKNIHHLMRKQKPTPYFYTKIKSLDLINKSALMIWEPSVVIPENGNELIHELFPRVFTWRENLFKNKSIYKPIRWPQPYKVPISANDKTFNDRKLLVNFSGNKSSSYPGELYSARKEVINYMSNNYPNDFDHFGPGWKGYPQWRGVAESKFNIYPNYRFGLCYENLLDEPGYITEKIFDCLRANCVPIYWGDPKIGNWIPSEAYIDRRKFSSTRDLIEFLLGINEETWQNYLKAGQNYIESESFKRYLPEEFTNLIIEGLQI